MGNDSSKEIREIENVLENGKESTRPVNQESLISYSVDPRSPSEGILRTPIEFRNEVLDVNGVYPLRRRWKSEPDVSPCAKEKYIKVSFHHIMDDPRSPTFGIVRTPIQVMCNEGNICDKNHGELSNEQISTVKSLDNIIEDCRSPSLGISRTPIQILDELQNVCEASAADNIVNDVSDLKQSGTTETWATPLSTKFCTSGSFVYTDDEGVASKTKNNIKVFESEGNEKENDVNLKRKLVFTPEQKTGIKVRTPLGSRCNYQDSPSQYLKIMQIQKLGQDVGLTGENVSNSASRSVKHSQKKNTVVDWDENSTFIM